MANNKLRNEARHPWWEDYDAEPFCVCGHDWRIPLPGKLAGDSLFSDLDLHTPLGKGRVMCIDYSVGGRHLERRLNGRSNGRSKSSDNTSASPAFTGRLAKMAGIPSASTPTAYAILMQQSCVQMASTSASSPSKSATDQSRRPRAISTTSRRTRWWTQSAREMVTPMCSAPPLSVHDA